ncbi:MAG: DUF1611 domain-containing protein [Gemmatimonadota bacterium]|nr:MAG: DUF1611 domain-containing protein [Gemmatimonadota bacterium]
MIPLPEGNAIVYCQGAYGTSNGKTAHGLVRRTRRYRVLSVVDAHSAGQDAGELLNGSPSSIPIYADVAAAVEAADHDEETRRPTHLVVGLAPDGGRLPPEARQEIAVALELGLNVDSGLHDFLSEDPGLVQVANRVGVAIRDIRKPPDRSRLHFFSGKIEEVDSLKIAVLGTDSAVGKRTTAWLLVDALQGTGRSAELIGTGQTAWMQGAQYCIVLDSLVNDFVAGEIEHAIWCAWNEVRPDVIVIEGQGSLMNPAYPGGHEILAAGRPDVVVLQHAPAREEYDGFRGYPLHPLPLQIHAIELLSGSPVVAIAISHEGLNEAQAEAAVAAIESETGLPCCDPLRSGVDSILASLSYKSKTRHDADR